MDQAYVCGPFAMIDTTCALLSDIGVPPDRVHVERFTSVFEGRPEPAAPVSDAPPFATATIIHGGTRTDVPVRRDEKVLDAALRAGLDLPFACKGGMCCTCRARLLQGEASMELNYYSSRGKCRPATSSPARPARSRRAWCSITIRRNDCHCEEAA